jgi:hypothetical protein
MRKRSVKMVADTRVTTTTVVTTTTRMGVDEGRVGDSGGGH